MTFYRSQSLGSIADLLIFSPLAGVFMIACIVAILTPLWLEFRARRKSGNPTYPLFSARCLVCYDFWVVALITAFGIFFTGKAMDINGVSGYFPQAVYAAIACLGLFIMIMRFFSGKSIKLGLPPITCLGNIGVYIAIMIMMYLLVDPLGFYTATFLGIFAMSIYGVFFFSGRKRDVKGLFVVLAYSIVLVAIECGCFRLLMDVQTPEGSLF